MDLTEDLENQSAYFNDFENSFCFDKNEIWTNREKELQDLDLKSWEIIRNKASNYLMKLDYVGAGWWHQLIEVLNEARGYNYLKSIGCTAIEFIPQAIEKSIDTPDLKGKLENCSILCEVKTINISKEEAFAQRFGACRESIDSIGSKFLIKLDQILIKAQHQMKDFDQGKNLRNIAYIIINFDDSTGEYKENYYHEIDCFLKNRKPAKIEVVFHNQKTIFHKSISMTYATVINEV
jgi:hypothetical protein